MARGFCVWAILLIVLLQVVPSVCLVSCADDDGACSCCPHAQPAILRDVRAATPLTNAARVFSPQKESSSIALATDIFHVPLLG
jgi:hypothetical protein